MYEVTLKTAKNNKIWMILAVSITIVLAFAGGKKVVNGAFAANSSSSEKVDVGSVVEAAVVKITSGDFDAAGDLISTVKGSSDPRALQLGRIIEEYKSFSKERDIAKSKSYEELLADLKGEGPKDTEKDDTKVKPDAKTDTDVKPDTKVKPDADSGKSIGTGDSEKIIDTDEEDEIDPEVKEINETFLKVLKVKEYANDKQKEELYSSEIVKSLVERALKKGVEFESEGEWVDAYAHCFYWLSALYPDSQEYKDQTERLTRLAMIEVSLKDNSCEKSGDRHAGITPKMLVRAVRALDFSYVSLLDYKEMAKKAIDQCGFLGQVLYEEKKDISYRVSVDAMKEWKVGLKKLKDELGSDDGVSKVVNRDDFVRIFSEVLVLNKMTIGIPEEIIVRQYSEASLEALDPFTNLIWPWKVLDFQKSMTQDFTGIGIHITQLRGVLSVASLLPDTPAYRSNLDANDEIIAVNGEITKGMTLTCVVSKITGPKGTKVTLTVRHEDAPEGETEDVTMVRDRIEVPTIRGWIRDSEDVVNQTNGGGTKGEGSGKWGHMIDPVNKIGYMRLTGFTMNTAPVMKEQLHNLEGRGMKGLIVDLRNNSGGYLSTAAAVVDMFVESGLIVKSQPRWGIANYERARKRGTHPNYPLIVLINGSSASASEIVAGALQDVIFKRATLVGTRSYGKGSVQTIVPYSGEGSQLKYTMAYYHLPSNQRVKNRYKMVKEGRKDWGIAPDVEVKMTSEEVKKHREIQWSNDVLAKAGHMDDKGKPVKRYTAQETIDADPQMRVAIMVALSKIIQAGGSVEFPEKTSDKAVAGK
jgi:carboxyl-terminal processing protease